MAKNVSSLRLCTPELHRRATACKAGVPHAHGFECSYTEIMYQVGLDSMVAINLTSENNHVCMHCHSRTIRLDIKVVDTIAMNAPQRVG